MDRLHAAFRARVEAIFSPVGDGNSGASMQSAGAQWSDDSCASRLFRECLERCAVPAADAPRYALLLLMQFADSEPTVTEKIRVLLDSSLRTGDMVWSWGPARLAILVDGLRDSFDGPMIAEKIYNLLENPYSWSGDSEAPRTWSGASVFQVDGSVSEYWWCRARAALERAFAFDAGTCCFAGLATGNAMMGRRDLTADAWHAWRNYDFFPVYQPVYTIDGTAITAVETLLRWQHPRLGLLYPPSFMRALEESGLIIPIGARILNEACQLAAQLMNRSGTGARIRVCVNVSVRQLEDPDFLLTVLDAIYDAGIAPDRLQLECSARDLHGSSIHIENVLVELGNAGVRIALDHFGAENTSPLAFAELPVTLIKMDRALTRDLVSSAVSRAVTAGTVAMLNEARMSVAAVDIEDPSIMAVLAGMGCIEVQGNVLADPQTADQLLRRLGT
ncbi:MAG: EAL domain-containing protein [Thiogranum sp.]|nr:EAL domain-containing protein [Thiogranum sp.]